MRSAFRAPRLYVLWAVFVVAALWVSWGVDPYVFAFTAMILAWLSAAAGLGGLVVIVFARSVSKAAKTAIGLALAATAAALWVAFEVLGRYNWA